MGACCGGMDMFGGIADDAICCGEPFDQAVNLGSYWIAKGANCDAQLGH